MYNETELSDEFRAEMRKSKYNTEEQNMAVIEELIREEETGALSFGNFALAAKTKKDGFQYQGDSYKIKTFREITKLERNGMFVYESVPGTVVHDFRATDKAVNFVVVSAARPRRRRNERSRSCRIEEKLCRILP